MTKGIEQKENILDAAFVVFGANGYHDAKMIDIAKKAGVSKGTLYLYFPSKESLYIAVNDRSFLYFIANAKRETNRCETFRQKLYSIARHHLYFFYNTRKYPDSFWQAPHQMPEMMERLHRFFDDYHSLVSDLMKEEGLEDTALHSKAFCSMLNGYRMDIVSNKNVSEKEIERYATFTVDLFLEGCY
ncbi:TetR/AcrR family transcriptional regulator [Priestia flexa]|uniref:TetR/AcrR family transcriptional regulator n=1 Tax=Priestia flexa TaxID=86664 RepID=UPI000E67E37D|nr:TetR/AcrR family transcriptional regulator [Priestia flexa]RIV09316.1 TetR/AcrR family transcriptional regulator [Priestia flexa]UIR28550.1 TetR/AcrR family transcriptional regulator [Priestia flexa]UZW65024.1 TetR/AcrR family transcriptional regulator [Priestia flexa]